MRFWLGAAKRVSSAALLIAALAFAAASPLRAQSTDAPAAGPAAEKPAQEQPAADKPTPDKPWVTLAPLPEPAADIIAAAVNGKLYVFGGFANNRARNLNYEYDTATNAWTKKKPMPVALHRFAIASYGDKIYLFGGFKYPDTGGGIWQPADTAWRYDPATDEWSPLAAMPVKLGAATASVADNRIYVLGGASVDANSKDGAIQPKRRHGVLGSNIEYDPKTNAWRTRSPLPTPRNHAASATVGGKIYVIGGRIASAFAEDGSDTDVVDGYDPARDLWSRPLERMPAARSASGVAMWRNRIVIVGGETSSAKGAGISGAIERYDPEKNSWSALPPLPSPRRGSAVGLIGDRLYIIGGEDSGGLSAASQALQLDVLR